MRNQYGRDTPIAREEMTCTAERHSGQNLRTQKKAIGRSWAEMLPTANPQLRRMLEVFATASQYSGYRKADMHHPSCDFSWMLNVERFNVRAVNEWSFESVAAPPACWIPSLLNDGRLRGPLTEQLRDGQVFLAIATQRLLACSHVEVLDFHSQCLL